MQQGIEPTGPKAESIFHGTTAALLFTIMYSNCRVTDKPLVFADGVLREKVGRFPWGDGSLDQLYA